jgi:UDP-GlcNAc:undecaprenyl-phosphate/decaprenyl-phosphate GlcNAc-1-phosphate transferase
MRGYLIVAVVAALVTFAVLPLAIRASHRFGVLAQPDQARRLHDRATPVLGGIPMLFGFLSALAVAWRLGQFSEMFESSSEPIGIALAAIIITAVGVADDVWEVSPPAKIAGQTLAGSALYLFGTTLDSIQLPFSLGVIEISPDLTPLLTVLWVIGMANAINLVDGLDGLAAGIVSIGAGAFLLYSARLFENQLISGSNVGPLIAALACGVCLGFLPYNFRPAQIFMGDAGAMLLGVLLAASTMVVGGRAVQGVPVRGQTYFFFAPLLIPFIILAVPIGDTIRLFLQRTVRGSGFSTADREHLHYRLLDLGHGPRRTVTILWALTTLFSGLALVPLYFRSRWALAPVVLGLIATAGFAFYHPDLREERRQRRSGRLAASLEEDPR